jgi:hypothetical protein
MNETAVKPNNKKRSHPDQNAVNESRSTKRTMKLCKATDDDGSPCDKGAKNGLCKRHGAGVRCAVISCTTSARSASDICIAHGGGTICITQGCDTGAEGTTNHCVRHGGGNRCTTQGWSKLAPSNN